MTINHIDQLNEWWENAEKGEPRAGDTIIQERGSQYMIKTAAQDWGETADERFTRILARAPKPKPAWHDAVAVIAHVGGNELPRVLVRDNDGALVDGLTGSAYMADRLRDATPLIEAKVTDEMVERAAQSLEDAGWDTSDGNTALADALTAALGLEAE